MTAVRAMMMRGGTSKGLFFLADDLPAAVPERDALLLRLMGSPDSRQIDGVGGAHPLTSKVAVVRTGDDGEIEYLFLQVSVDRASVSSSQNCGNMLAGVGPFAIERGLVAAVDGVTDVPIRLMNTGGRAVAHVHTPGGSVTYEGTAAIDGVPGTAAPVVLDFLDVAGSTCGSLLPTGRAVDMFDWVPATCVDNGMPVVVLRASDFGVTGRETPAELDGDSTLRERLERVRLLAGAAMGLGDVIDATVPKMTLVSGAVSGGSVNTRTFIPHRCHAAIGVLGAASVAAALRLPGSLVYDATVGSRVAVEHPSGALEVELELDDGAVVRTGIVRTARKLFDGVVFG